MTENSHVSSCPTPSRARTHPSCCGRATITGCLGTIMVASRLALHFVTARGSEFSMLRGFRLVIVTAVSVFLSLVAGAALRPPDQDTRGASTQDLLGLAKSGDRIVRLVLAQSYCRCLCHSTPELPACDGTRDACGAGVPTLFRRLQLSGLASSFSQRSKMPRMAGFSGIQLQRSCPAFASIPRPYPQVTSWISAPRKHKVRSNLFASRAVRLIFVRLFIDEAR